MKSLAKTIIGWKETVCFVDWNISRVVAVSDTGRKRSVLNGTNITIIDESSVEFDFYFNPLNPTEKQRVSAELVRYLEPISSNDPAEKVPLLVTQMKLGSVVRKFEFVLESRTNEKHAITLGRKTLSGSFIVDSDKKYIESKKPKKDSTIVNANSQTDTAEAFGMNNA